MPDVSPTTLAEARSARPVCNYADVIINAIKRGNVGIVELMIMY
jgi:hypothetical protein